MRRECIGQEKKGKMSKEGVREGSRREKRNEVGRKYQKERRKMTEKKNIEKKGGKGRK